MIIDTLTNHFFIFSLFFLHLQVNFSEQNLNGKEPPRGDTPGSGMSLPPTPDSSDRIPTGNGNMLEPLSAGSE